MKTMFVRLAIVATLITASTAVYAASCTEGPITVSGHTCGVVSGHCACSD